MSKDEAMKAQDALYEAYLADARAGNDLAKLRALISDAQLRKAQTEEEVRRASARAEVARKDAIRIEVDGFKIETTATVLRTEDQR